MMPSLKRKLEYRNRVKAAFPLARGLVVEISIYVVERVKQALTIAAVCKLFRKELLENNRFWYYVYCSYKKTQGDDYDYARIPPPFPNF
jgi:hypothetical protein